MNELELVTIEEHPVSQREAAFILFT
jgi:hypothetical protein